MVMTGKRPLEDGLVLSLVCEEGIGVPKDHSQYHHATAWGAKTWTTVDGKSAINFIPTGYLVVTSNAVLNPAALSVMAWVVVDSLYSAASGTIIRKDNVYALGVGSDGYIGGYIYISGVGWRGSWTFGEGPLLTDGEKHHLVWVYNDPDFKLYVDGVLVHTLDTGGGAITTVSANDVTIGGRAANEYLDGKILNIGLYNKPLTDEEVALNAVSRILGQPIPNLEEGLVLDLRFSEGTGLVAHDVSGERNHGALVGPPNWAVSNGKRCLALNGSSDYVLMVNAASLQIVDAITIAFSIKLTHHDSYNYIISKRSITDNFQINIYFTANQLAGFWGTGSGRGVIATSIIGDYANWHRFIVAIDTTTINVYRDAMNIMSDSSTGISLLGDAEIHIGKYQLSAVAEYFIDGSIDDIRIYNRILNEPEIALDYAQRRRV